MRTVVVRLPDRRVVGGAVRLRDLVVLRPRRAAKRGDRVGEVGEDHEDPILPGLLQLDVLSLGDLVNPAPGFTGQLGFQALLPELELLRSPRMLRVVSATASDPSHQRYLGRRLALSTPRAAPRGSSRASTSNLVMGNLQGLKARNLPRIDGDSDEMLRAVTNPSSAVEGPARHPPVWSGSGESRCVHSRLPARVTRGRISTCQ